MENTKNIVNSNDDPDSLSAAIFDWCGEPLSSSVPSSAIVSSCYYFLPVDGTVRHLSHDLTDIADPQDSQSFAFYTPQQTTYDSSMTIALGSKTASFAGFDGDEVVEGQYREPQGNPLVFPSSFSHSELVSQHSTLHRDHFPPAPLSREVSSFDHGQVNDGAAALRIVGHPLSTDASHSASWTTVDYQEGASGIFESVTPFFFNRCSTG